ncbi:iron export ABC transporter permease subunit FetB [Desulfoluna limicola]|uniref:Iron export ABC transporter permease subunit FetB n=1 Tax=Desulfoluna limicola TaxID=2810562 RepID=A0ABM7PMD1_9BACT|nr:iron export ABC transporter permease subunit FetB [Desulfoluna limicola]BCS98415.1 iron export ABC transporter permease subunit FetB [Desulfoluna limicola]
MSSMITLSPLDLSIAAFLVVALAVLSFRMKLGVTRQIVVAALRTTIQLLLVGMVLKTLFDHAAPWLLALIALVMVTTAGWEVMSRQTRRLAGIWGFATGTAAMTVSSFSITCLVLATVIRIDPWYTPQYAVPLLGMMLGNTMTGIAIGMERLTSTAWRDSAVIEGRLLLGQTWREAITEIRRESIRSAMIPTLNAMAVAGIVSLPGMMTGQILAGSPPMEAVKYQILIMFTISAGTGFGAILAVSVGARRLFDERQRLRLDRLTS